MTVERAQTRFRSGSEDCAAWLYASPRPSSSCVVMAHGFSLTRHDGLPAYAERLAAAGTNVLVFDHRHLGDSGGMPRQRFRTSEQRADWRAAVAHARSLEGVDPARIVLWGFSFSGAHAVQTAAADPSIAATMVLCPLLDGLWRALQTPPALTAWLLPRAIADQLGHHNLVPVTDRPGGHAAMTLPGEAEGFARSIAAGSPWRNEISPAVFLTVAMQRALGRARGMAMPVWLGLGESDVSVSARAIERFARDAPDSELRRYPYDHFGAFLDDGPDRVAGDQIDFLTRRGLLAR